MINNKQLTYTFYGIEKKLQLNRGIIKKSFCLNYKSVIPSMAPPADAF